MPYTAEAKRLFREKDREFLEKIIGAGISLAEEILAAPRSVRRELKHKLDLIEYISLFYIHGLPKDKSALKFHNTKTKRLKILWKIKKYLGRNPDADDFITVLNIEISITFYRSLDQDIGNLLSGN